MYPGRMPIATRSAILSAVLPQRFSRSGGGCATDRKTLGSSPARGGFASASAEGAEELPGGRLCGRRRLRVERFRHGAPNCNRVPALRRGEFPWCPVVVPSKNAASRRGLCCALPQRRVNASKGREALSWRAPAAQDLLARRSSGRRGKLSTVLRSPCLQGHPGLGPSTRRARSITGRRCRGSSSGSCRNTIGSSCSPSPAAPPPQGPGS